MKRQLLECILHGKPLPLPTNATGVLPLWQFFGHSHYKHFGAVLLLTVYYLEDAEAAAEFAHDAGLLHHLPDGGDARLLLGLHAAAGYDPVVRPAGRRHQQHLRLIPSDTDAGCPPPEAVLVVNPRRVRLFFHHLFRSTHTTNRTKSIVKPKTAH